MSAVSVSTALVLLTANYGQSNAGFIKGDTSGSWIEGEEWCNNNGRHLASIHSDAENTLANNACLTGQGYGNCWIGAQGSGDGDWSWADGSVWNYNKWKGTAGDEDCGYILYTDWYDYNSAGCRVLDLYPICGDEVSTAGCVPLMSGFEWGEVNGVWTPVDGEFRSGAPVYSRQTYGSTTYLFKLTAPWGDEWDAWVTGYALDGSLGYWEWRWGGNLWDSSDNPYNYPQSWWYYTGSQWKADIDATVTCSSASTDNSAPMMSGSGVVWNGTMLDGAHTFPMHDGQSAAAASTTSLIGAAIGAVAVVAIVVAMVSMARRRKRAGMEEETQIAVELGMGKAAVNSVESVTAEMPSENETVAATEGDVATEVAVEIVAPKVDDAVSVQQEE